MYDKLNEDYNWFVIIMFYLIKFLLKLNSNIFGVSKSIIKGKNNGILFQNECDK